MFIRNLEAIIGLRKNKKIFSNHYFILSITILLERCCPRCWIFIGIVPSNYRYLQQRIFSTVFELLECVINHSTNHSLAITAYIRNGFSNPIFSKTKQKIEKFYSIYIFFIRNHVLSAFTCYMVGSCIYRVSDDE